jgi:hypothetical protein
VATSIIVADKVTLVTRRAGVLSHTLTPPGVGAQPVPRGSVVPVYGLSASKSTHGPDASGSRPIARSAAASWLL